MIFDWWPFTGTRTVSMISCLITMLVTCYLFFYKPYHDGGSVIRNAIVFAFLFMIILKGAQCSIYFLQELYSTWINF